ncbi:hypothetical protein AU467_32095 [Mesorhizobium loti]|uniref:Uncharacterized protein n=1 Tax=Rhizobium loti TaxID=381 RepID=A0A117N213_RHILI|nr:hypothetical protein AU467_32095 [Mesorhizobium loti]
MVIVPPDTIGEVEGDVCESGTLKVPHAAFAALGSTIVKARIASQTRGARMAGDRRPGTGKARPSFPLSDVIRAKWRTGVNTGNRAAQSGAINARSHETLSPAVCERPR